MPLDKYEGNVEDLLLERVPFWKFVNKKIREEEPFKPIRIFRHSMQSFYVKTRGGVDGNSQTNTVLKNSSTVRKWEQKVLLIPLKLSWSMPLWHGGCLRKRTSYKLEIRLETSKISSEAEQSSVHD